MGDYLCTFCSLPDQSVFLQNSAPLFEPRVFAKFWANRSEKLHELHASATSIHLFDVKVWPSSTTVYSKWLLNIFQQMLVYVIRNDYCTTWHSCVYAVEWIKVLWKGWSLMNSLAVPALDSKVAYGRIIVHLDHRSILLANIINSYPGLFQPTIMTYNNSF